MRKLLLFYAVVLFAAAPGHAENKAASYQGEIVMTAKGELVSPWKRTRICGQSGQQDCRDVIYNPKTKEAASLDGRWSTQFEPTGQGQEVRRAEKALEKAKRLNAH